MAIGTYKDLLTNIGERYRSCCLETYKNLGIVYHDLASIQDENQDKKKYLNLAIKTYEDALENADDEEYPIECAMILKNLGIAYHDLAEIKDYESHIEKTIDTYKKYTFICRKNGYISDDYLLIVGRIGDARHKLDEIRNKTNIAQTKQTN